MCNNSAGETLYAMTISSRTPWIHSILSQNTLVSWLLPMIPFATIIFCPLLHVTTIALISLRRTHKRPQLLVQCLGVATCIFTLQLPYQYTDFDRLLQCPLRVVCFFYAMKTLDLALCRSENPPVLITSTTEERSPDEGIITLSDHIRYTWLLLAEMRYNSFSIAITQKYRPPLPKQSRDLPSSLLASLLALSLTLAYPLAELACLTLLLLVRLGFETLHFLIHPSCERPLFYRPFSTLSMSAFWTTHWHACAGPFLNNLGYKPARKLVGRWFGVLAAFGLSGIWHG